MFNMEFLLSPCRRQQGPLSKSFHFPQQYYSICHRGILILCSERGCACVDDLEVVSRLLESTQRQDSCEAQEIDYYIEMVNDLKSKVLIRENSQRDPSHMHPLKAGIILQLETIGVEMTTQRKVDNNNLISRLEEREKILMAKRVQTMEPRRKLNQKKIKMAHLEWYNKICKTKGIGYYNCYKNQLGSSDREVTRLKKFLTNYWKSFVEGVERKPQKEGAFIRGTRLYCGRNYRRMVEPQREGLCWPFLNSAYSHTHNSRLVGFNHHEYVNSGRSPI